jgi:hypothetical protein
MGGPDVAPHTPHLRGDRARGSIVPADNLLLLAYNPRLPADNPLSPARSPLRLEIRIRGLGRRRSP